MTEHSRLQSQNAVDPLRTSYFKIYFKIIGVQLISFNAASHGLRIYREDQMGTR